MSAAIKPSKIETTLPNSRRIYINGEQAGVRVPFREIDQNPTRNFDNTLEENSPVRVYDTSGPYGDPSTHCDAREGLPPLRGSWIFGRGDVEHRSRIGPRHCHLLSLGWTKECRSEESGWR